MNSPTLDPLEAYEMGIRARLNGPKKPACPFKNRHILEHPDFHLAAQWELGFNFGCRSADAASQQGRGHSIAIKLVPFGQLSQTARDYLLWTALRLGERPLNLRLRSELRGLRQTLKNAGYISLSGRVTTWGKRQMIDWIEANKGRAPGAK